MNFLNSARSVILLIASLLCVALQVQAQDDHYWSQQYGAQSTLMGGAMVGGVRDNTAVFYNPGAVGFLTHPSLSVDANVYRMDRIFIDDGAGIDVNLNSAQISIFPQIISGMINLIKSDRFKFSYTLLTRNYNNVLMNTRYTSHDFQLKKSTVNPSTKSYVGAFDYNNQLNEQWFGLGVGYKVNEKLGIGGTLFLSYRAQSYQLTNYVRDITKMDSAYTFSTANEDEAMKYKTFRLIFKLGLSYSTGRWKFGLTLTTPSIGLFGSGDIQRENSLVYLSPNAGDTSAGFILMDRVTGVKAVYKHPFSIAGGIDYQTEKTRIAISVEYFFKIKTYHLFKPDSDPFIYPPSYADTATIKALIADFLHVENASKPVCNVSIGLSQELWKKISLLLGASTDFSSYMSPDESDNLLHSSGTWDLYHLSAGLTYHREKHSITLGFSYGFSPSIKIDPYTVINKENESNSNARVFAQSFSLVIGYTYYFAKFTD
ncbi:MAG: hypothetical protein PHF97_02465 [Bacteroidales bacterium]|nr:hypothetical protein [Bacteroidales bacterium]MDD4602656.1 hypothetical protein [Bacteroidales bacterium]